MNDEAIIVIQCAARKRKESGCLQLGNGSRVLFVGRPEKAPRDGQYIYTHPDGTSDTGEPWREKLLLYNELRKDAGEDNPLGLLPAWKLYRHPVYTRLADKYETESLYILSAGWGLIRADFLTPNYDITFSNNAELCKRRRARDVYNDWRMLPDDTDRPIVFFGGQSYINLFCSLTARVKGARYLFYNSAKAPDAPGCQTVRFYTHRKTNWHYEAVQAFMNCRTGI